MSPPRPRGQPLICAARRGSPTPVNTENATAPLVVQDSSDSDLNFNAIWRVTVQDINANNTANLVANITQSFNATGLFQQQS